MGVSGQIQDALGEARAVLNIGAGAGAYEQPGSEITAGPVAVLTCDPDLVRDF